MKANHSSVFLEVIEKLSKSTSISEGDQQGIAKNILEKSTELLKIPRANAWLMNEDQSEMTCLMSYIASTNTFQLESSLKRSELPIYFEHISKNDIIISVDAQNEKFNQELREAYLIPFDIQSMMEVPIISGGSLKGIVCFEHTSSKREWTTDEQHFAIALAQLLTITIETNAKNTYRTELEKALKVKSLLISEINHRVKNNLAIITAFIRSESERAKDDYHKRLFDSILSKTYSLASLQEELYRSANYQELNFNKYIEQLANNMNRTFGSNLKVNIIFHSTETFFFEVDIAMPIALICSEILNNCFKYAFQQDGVNQISIFLGKDQNGKTFLSIEDNGSGLPENYLTRGTGFELMKGLAEQIDAQLECLTSSTGTQISLKF